MEFFFTDDPTAVTNQDTVAEVTAIEQDTTFSGLVTATDPNDLIQIPAEFVGLTVHSNQNIYEVNKQLVAWDPRISYFTIEALDYEIPLLSINSKVEQGVMSLFINTFILIPSKAFFINKKGQNEIMEPIDLIQCINDGIINQPIFYLQQAEKETLIGNFHVNKYDQTVVETSRFNILRIINPLPIFTVLTKPLEFLRNEGRSKLQKMVDRRKLESNGPIELEDVFQTVLNMRKQNHPDCAGLFDNTQYDKILKGLDKIEPKNRFIKDGQIITPVSRYINNVKRAHWPIPCIPLSDELRTRMVDFLTDGQKRGKYKLPKAPKFTQVINDKSLADRKVFKINTTDLTEPLIQTMTFKDKPTVAIQPEDHLLVNQAEEWNQEMHRLYQLFEGAYELDNLWQSRKTGLSILHEDNVKFNADLLKAFKAKNDFHEIYSTLFDRNLSTYFDYCCHLKASHASSLLGTMSADKQHWRIEYNKIPTLTNDGTAEVILTGEIREGTPRQVKVRIFTLVTQRVKDILMSTEYQQLANEYSILHNTRPEFIPWEGNWIYSYSILTSDAIVEPMLKFLTFIVLGRDDCISKHIKDHDWVRRHLILSNIFNRRRSEEVYYWIRIMLLAPFRPVCRPAKSIKEILSMCFNEGYSLGLLIKIIKDNIDHDYTIETRSQLVDYMFPYASPEPTVNSTSSGTFETIEHMVKPQKLGLPKDELESKLGSDPDGSCNFDLFCKGLKAYGPLNDEQIKLLEKRLGLYQPLRFMQIEGAKIGPHTFKIENPITATGEIPAVYGNALSDTREILNQFAYMYLTDQQMTVYKHKADPVLYMRLCNKIMPAMPCDIYHSMRYLHMKSLPTQKKFYIRGMTPCILSTKGTPKRERIKAKARDIYVAGVINLACLKTIEAIADAMLRTDYGATILNGVPEKIAKIMQLLRDTLHMVQEMVAISYDAQKYHTTMSIGLQIYAMIEILKQTLAQTINTATRALIEKNIESLEICAGILFYKCLFITSLKMVFDGEGKKYYADHLTDVSGYYQPESAAKLTELLESQQLCCKDKLTIRLGEDGEGFQMGLTNKGATLLQTIAGALLETYDENVKINTAHSSDDSSVFAGLNNLDEIVEEQKIPAEQVRIFNALVCFDYHNLVKRAIFALCSSAKKTVASFTDERGFNCIEYNTVFVYAKISKRQANIFTQEALTRDANVTMYHPRFEPEAIAAYFEPFLSSKNGPSTQIQVGSMAVAMYRFAQCWGLLQGEHWKMYLALRDTQMAEFITNYQMPRYFPWGQFAGNNELEMRFASALITKDYGKLHRLVRICTTKTSYDVRKQAETTATPQSRIIPVHGLLFHGAHTFKTIPSQRNKQTVIPRETTKLIDFTRMAYDALKSEELT
jgi:hypothetical protein